MIDGLVLVQVCDKTSGEIVTFLVDPVYGAWYKAFAEAMDSDSNSLLVTKIESFDDVVKRSRRFLGKDYSKEV